MKFIKKSLAFVLAASLLALSACHSPQKNLTDIAGTSSQAVQSQNGGKFSFTTADRNGSEVSFEDYGAAKVIMFNMWEPWCGPCRSELPDLQKLYAKYKDDGLMIVGVYSDTDGLEEIVKENRLQYPMIRFCAEFERFQTGAVPTTFFTDGEGNVLSGEPYVGSRSYEEWESIILSYLK